MPARCLAVSICLLASACSEAPEEPQFRAHDLEISHPAPYANYVSVAPGTYDAALPRPRQIKSRGFSRYLRAKTGCVADPARDMAVLGPRAMPAAYMVPVICP